MDLNKHVYILTNLEGKLYFVRSNAGFRVGVDDVFNNILIGNYDIIYDKKYTLEQKEKSFEKYLLLLENAGFDYKDKSIKYVDFCYDAFRKLKGEVGPKFEDVIKKRVYLLTRFQCFHICTNISLRRRLDTMVWMIIF